MRDLLKEYRNHIALESDNAFSKQQQASKCFLSYQWLSLLERGEGNARAQYNFKFLLQAKMHVRHDLRWAYSYDG